MVDDGTGLPARGRGGGGGANRTVTAPQALFTIERANLWKKEIGQCWRAGSERMSGDAGPLRALRRAYQRARLGGARAHRGGARSLTCAHVYEKKDPGAR